jgi:long-chain acyl-CoA synthetase
MASTLPEAVQETITRRPRRPFLLSGGTKLKYRDFGEAVGIASRGLARNGVRPGDRVALVAGNIPEAVVAIFALLRIGASVVPINPRLTPAEIGRLLERAEVRACAADSESVRKVEPLSTLPPVRLLLEGERRGWLPLATREKTPPSVAAAASPKPDDEAFLLFTSGTDGAPRGVRLTHRNLLANIEQLREGMQPTEKDRFLLFLPLFHVFSLTVCILLPAVLGASLVLVRSAHNFPAMMKRDVLFRRVTIFVAVPAVYNLLARKEIPYLFRKLNRIRMMISGAAPLSPAVIGKVESRFEAPLLEGYGLTEASPVVSVNRPAGRKPGSVGTPLPGVEVKVVGEAGGELPAGEAGELWVRGENVARALLGEDSLLDEEGWLQTGDVASLDGEGFLTIHDRMKDVILVRGVNVYPREIEEALLEHPAVELAAVVGAPHPLRGETPRAFLVLGEERSATPEELREHLKARLASFKIPHHWEFLPDLPRGGTGKVLRRVLREKPLPASSPGDPSHDAPAG